jgi:hypothetical protein
MWAAIQSQNLKALSNFIQGDMKAALQNPKLAACTLFAPTDEGKSVPPCFRLAR